MTRATLREFVEMLFVLIVVAALDWPLMATMLFAIAVDIAIDTFAVNATVIRLCLVCGLVCLIVSGWIRERYDERW